MAFTPKTRKFLVAFLILGWSVTLAVSFYRRPDKPGQQRLYRDNRVLMGTFWEVDSPDQEAPKIVFKEVARLEQLLSKYIPSSEVSRLNATGKIKASPDTFYVIKKSLELNRKTLGAFDITVGPLVELWGFSDRKFRVPGGQEINGALKLVGSDKIILHEKDSVIEFKITGTKIDLGGAAKGYALDCAVKKLKEKNINSCLINAGGQVYGLGQNSGKPWKVAVQGSRDREIAGMLELQDRSASTSGDYQQYFTSGSKRYSHIIDPRTGYPAQAGITSVTVVAESALLADIFSTAAFVLGEQGLREILKDFPAVAVKFYQ